MEPQENNLAATEDIDEVSHHDVPRLVIHCWKEVASFCFPSSICSTLDSCAVDESILLRSVKIFLLRNSGYVKESYFHLSIPP